MMKKIRPKILIECRYCRKKFIPPTANARYCSEDCRLEAQKERDRQKKEMKTCLRCGKRFEAPFRSSRWYCDECKKREKIQEERKRKPEKQDRKARAEKMRKIKESGLTYGQYMAGATNAEPKEYEGTIMHDQLSNRWDEKKPVTERIVLHPRARIKVDLSKLTPPPAIGTPRKHYADQSEKEPDDARKEETKEETETETAGHNLHKMLQAQQVF